MDAKYINPALNAIVNVMKMMVHQDIERGEILVKNNDLAFGEVSSLIRLEGKSGIGSMSVSYPLDVIMNIANIMLPPDSPRDNAMIKDLTGEMSNMIAGSTKTELENIGLHFDISLPQISAGKPHHLKHVCPSTIFIPFTAPVGAFFVEFCFVDQDTRGLKHM